MDSTELSQLIDMLRSKGVLEYETPQLKLKMLPQLPELAQGEGANCAVPARPPLEPAIERALKRLPANYQDPSLWNLGDRV